MPLDPQAPVELPKELEEKLTIMFEKMDVDKNGKIDMDEAIKFWGKNFAKVNASAMFNEVDTDKNGELSLSEWKDFWKNVLQHDYSADDVLEEVRTRHTIAELAALVLRLSHRPPILVVQRTHPSCLSYRGALCFCRVH